MKFPSALMLSVAFAAGCEEDPWPTVFTDADRKACFAAVENGSTHDGKIIEVPIRIYRLVNNGDNLDSWHDPYNLRNLASHGELTDMVARASTEIFEPHGITLRVDRIVDAPAHGLRYLDFLTGGSRAIRPVILDKDLNGAISVFYTRDSGTGPSAFTKEFTSFIFTQSVRHWILAHEIGHVLGLLHTINRDARLCPPNLTDDCITDTPYDRGRGALNGDVCALDESSCEQVCGDYSLPAYNIMAPYQYGNGGGQSVYSDCRDVFTRGQAAQMACMARQQSSKLGVREFSPASDGDLVTKWLEDWRSLAMMAAYE